MIDAMELNLRYTVESGQPLTFYSHCSASGSNEKLDYVTQTGHISLSRSRKSGRITYGFSGEYTSSTAEREIRGRLGLDDDLHDIYSHINTDAFMARAIADLHGMRITRNEPWEAALCFVVSQFNNMRRIRGIMLRIIGRFGAESGEARLFPAPEALASASVSDIRACGAGFRDRYIKHVAEQFAYSLDPGRLYRAGYDEAKEALMDLEGIGDKVADCILLFGYGKQEAFPIDTWVKRVMERVYFNGRKRSIRQLHEFSEERWGCKYTGYAQQYIFESGRRNRIR